MKILHNAARFLLLTCVLAFYSQKTSAADEFVPLEVLVEHLGGRDFSALAAALQSDMHVLGARVEADANYDIDAEEERLRTLLSLTLKKLPEEFLTSSSWASENADFLEWLFLDADLLMMVSAEIRPEDKVEELLKGWSRLWRAEPSDEFRKKYAALAFALAAIYDDPRRHPRAKDEAYHPTLTMDERYEYFRDASESGQLSTPASRLSVRDLVNIVNLNISKDEIAWAHRHASTAPKRIGSLYESIEYLMERAVDGNFSPYESYVLSEIKKHGGICGDQAHYASNAARAQGIATTVVVGTGNRGAHAWIGFMPDANEWAYYASQGITNGYVTCSQTGRRLLTSEIERESLPDYEMQRRAPQLRRLHIAAAALEDDHLAAARVLIDQAKRLGKYSREIWVAEADLLKKDATGAEAWAEYLGDFERTFSDYPTMQDWGLRMKIRHLFAALPEDEQSKLLEREIRRVARKVGSEGSALIKVVDEVAGMMIELDPADAEAALLALYSRSFRRYGEDLELFTKLLGSFSRQGAKVASLKPRIPDESYKFYKRVVETNSKEYFRADMELDILNRIIRMYRQAGGAENKAKADDLKKDYDRRKKKIEKAAL